MIERRAPSELDGAVDRAASAARALAAVAHNAARQHVQRDAVPSYLHWRDTAMVPGAAVQVGTACLDGPFAALDVAERERQARLRRWQSPAHPNRKDG